MRQIRIEITEQEIKDLKLVRNSRAFEYKNH